MLDPDGYHVALSGGWRHKREHITLKEGRALTLAVRRIARSSCNHSRKHLMLVDNLALAFAAGKGRSANHAMLRVTQKLGQYCLLPTLC